eukprot:COSAG01_NODE_1900_length_8964_cov_121.219177_15_plen_222_part_00
MTRFQDGNGARAPRSPPPRPPPSPPAGWRALEIYFVTRTGAAQANLSQRRAVTRTGATSRGFRAWWYLELSAGRLRVADRHLFGRFHSQFRNNHWRGTGKSQPKWGQLQDGNGRLTVAPRRPSISESGSPTCVVIAAVSIRRRWPAMAAAPPPCPRAPLCCPPPNGANAFFLWPLRCKPRTQFERPSTATRRPSSATPWRSSSSITAAPTCHQPRPPTGEM